MSKRSIKESLAAFQTYDLIVFKNICLQLFEDEHDITDVIKFLESDKSRLRINPTTRVCDHCKKSFQLIGYWKDKTIFSCPICKHDDIVDGDPFDHILENIKIRPFNEDERLFHLWKAIELMKGGTPIKCEKCGVLKQNLIMIKEPKGPANVHGWKSEIYCPSCENDEFSTKEVIEYLREITFEELLNASN